VHIISTEATALSHATRLYQTDPTARSGLLRAVDCIVKVNEAGGKLIICGVGKSGYIGMKIVATMKSLGLGGSFLHAAEAMHGDLGDIRPVCVCFPYLVVSFPWLTMAPERRSSVRNLFRQNSRTPHNCSPRSEIRTDPSVDFSHQYLVLPSSRGQNRRDPTSSTDTRVGGKHVRCFCPNNFDYSSHRGW
jgi:hypothetical protein